MMKGLPVYTVDLVDELDETFPHKCPIEKDSERRIWMDAGRRELIDWLVRKKELQQDSLPDVFNNKKK